MVKKVVSFNVRIEYEEITDTASAISWANLRLRLAEAIEHTRQESMLTDHNLSANWVEVNYD